MQALTIWQPWASAIIHAGKTMDKDAIEDVGCLWPEMPDDMPLGAIIGVGHLHGAVHVADKIPRTPWACGPWYWLLRRPIALPEPIPCKGLQGLWPVPAEHEETIKQAVNAALQGG